MKLRWQLFEEEGERLVDGWRLNDMVIVQDQDQGMGRCSQIVKQGNQHFLCRRGLGCLQKAKCALAHGRFAQLQGGDEVA